eukprot:TRINITY_DN30499_c0_g1_i1.p1 TRINITY_DN30499_c0_g1~~TRINITY_DN30499_c0_g1_i1.p1  ORF type:complete len:194 (+),score=29.17 TRINITY_DN30499_c0_g1_i1:88-669(+)
MTEKSHCSECTRIVRPTEEAYEQECGHVIHKTCWEERKACAICEEEKETNAEIAFRSTIRGILEEGTRTMCILADPVEAEYTSELYLNLEKAPTRELHRGILLLGRVLEARADSAAKLSSTLSEVVLRPQSSPDEVLPSLRRLTKAPPRHPEVRTNRAEPVLKLDPPKTLRPKDTDIAVVHQAWGPSLYSGGL